MPLIVIPAGSTATASWQPVRLATTANIAALAGGAPNTADGIAVALNDRILVRSQGALPTNGIYVVSVVGGGANGTWIRAADAGNSADFVDGKTVGVGQGNTLADTLWRLTSNAPFVLGVDNVVFIQDENSGWTRDAGVTRLTTIADQIGMGTATPLAGTKFEAVLDDAANAVISDVGVLTHSTTGVPGAGIGAGLRFRAEATAGLTNAGALRSWLTNVGAGTEASEMGLYTRTAGGALTLRWSVKATGGLDPGIDAAYGIGTSLFRISDIVSNAFRVFAAASDPNASYSLTNASGLEGGLGGINALSARLYCTALNTWTVDNGAAGSAVFSVLGTTITQARKIATAFGTINYTMDSGATPDEFIGINPDTPAANRTSTLVAAVTGRRVTIKHTGLLASAFTVAVIPDGVQTIDGVAYPAGLLLSGTQAITLVGLTGTGWYVI